MTHPVSISEELELKPLYGSISQSKAVEPKFSAIDEACHVVRFALPGGIASCAHNAIVTIDSVFLSHLSVNDMAGASLAFNITDALVKLYAPSAYNLTPLVAQAVGAGNPRLAGNWLQLVLGLLCLDLVPSPTTVLVGFFPSSHFCSYLPCPQTT